MKNREQLIELIAKHLLTTGYIRSDNYNTYSLKELLKTCSIYNIKVE